MDETATQRSIAHNATSGIAPTPRAWSIEMACIEMGRVVRPGDFSVQFRVFSSCILNLPNGPRNFCGALTTDQTPPAHSDNCCVTSYYVGVRSPPHPPSAPGPPPPAPPADA
eukprot:scaffold83756_cov42-Phaeocystis_antarctica.AAC.1